MRLFAALLPPPGAAAELARAVRRLHPLPGADELRWTRRENWHLTLAFYGSVTDAQLPLLAAGLGRAAHSGGPVRLALAGAGHFGSRALWAGVEGAQQELSGLARSCALAGSGSGTETNRTHPFHPHLTLAHAHGRRECAAVVSCAERLAEFRGSPWTAGELVLVRSLLPSGGARGEQPRHERTAGWPLGV